MPFKPEDLGPTVANLTKCNLQKCPNQLYASIKAQSKSLEVKQINALVELNKKGIISNAELKQHNTKLQNSIDKNPAKISHINCIIDKCHNEALAFVQEHLGKKTKLSTDSYLKATAKSLKHI